MNNLVSNVLVGSILGDGSLSLYGRSKNALFREHGSPLQNGYRKWKSEKLGIKFIPDKNKIYSRSLPIYTKYYNLFYINKIKTVTKENIKLLNHAIGLMCLYFDDGSLVIDSYKRKDGIHIFPRIYLYTQSFSKEENLILINHIHKTFGITFNLKKVPNGSGYCLNLNKRNEIVKMINLIKPYAQDIPCMQYKINIIKRLNDYKEKHSMKTIFIDNLNTISNFYSKEDELKIKKMLLLGYSQKKISLTLNRSYYGIVDKIRRMKLE